MYEITGNVYLVKKEQVISEKFKKRELVLHIPNEKNSDWDNHIIIEFIQDKTSLLDSVKAGDAVTVGFFINGRRWQKDPKSEQMFFVSLRGIEIKAASANNDSAAKGTSTPGDTIYAKDINANPDEEDLPF